MATGELTKNANDEDASSDGLSTQNIPKSVVFKDLEIREYPIILGDNPSVTSGIPVTIDWMYKPLKSQELEEYENARVPRRDLYEMRLPAKVRTKLLITDFSQDELKKVYLATTKIQRQRKMTVANLDTPLETASVAINSVKRKLKLFLQKPKIKKV